MVLRHLAIGSIVAAGSWLTHSLLLASFAEPSGFQLIPNGNAKANGCRTGGTGGINASNPSWVNAVLRDHRAKVIEGSIAYSHVTHEDFPFNHDSHDMCFFIDPDPAFQNLQSDANGIRDGRRVLEGEWETKHFPPRFWPVQGDRAWVMGRHVFDCGHPPYRTEIHPPVATAFTRLDPFIFPGSTAPSLANKTYVYMANQGGYFVQKVGGRDYIFNIPLPARPAGPGVTPRTHIIHSKAGMPAPILTPKMVGNQQMIEVRVPLSQVADPTTPWNLYEWIPRVSKLPITDQRRYRIDRPTNIFQYEAIIATGWSSGAARTSSPGFREISVTFNNYKVHNDHEGAVSGKAEWNVQLRANGQWIMLPERSLVKDDTITVNRTATFMVPENGAVSIQAGGWEDDNDSKFRVGPMPGITDIGALNENEKLGEILTRFTAAQNFGVGTHSMKSSSGDYTLNVTIRELRRFAGTGIGGIRDSIRGGIVRPPIRTTGGDGGG